MHFTHACSAPTSSFTVNHHLPTHPIIHCHVNIQCRRRKFEFEIWNCNIDITGGDLERFVECHETGSQSAKIQLPVVWVGTRGLGGSLIVSCGAPAGNEQQATWKPSAMYSIEFSNNQQWQEIVVGVNFLRTATSVLPPRTKPIVDLDRWPPGWHLKAGRLLTLIPNMNPCWHTSCRNLLQLPVWG